MNQINIEIHKQTNKRMNNTMDRQIWEHQICMQINRHIINHLDIQIDKNIWEQIKEKIYKADK